MPRLTASLIALILLAGAARAVTLRGPADVASLTNAADAVVRARVARTSSDWAGGDPKSGVIYTTVELQPLEWWKGAAQPAVTVRVPGGEVGEFGQISQGAASFSAGDEVVVFLKRSGEVFEVERWALGKFTVRAARAVRSREGVSCRECRAGEPDELPLEDLRSRVHAAAAGSPR